MNINDVDDGTRAHLAQGLFAPSATVTSLTVLDGLRSMPMGGAAETPEAWAARIALIRRLVCFGPQSRRALQILKVVGSPGFARALESRAWVDARAVRAALAGPANRMSPEELGILRQAFFGGVTPSREEVDALTTTLCLHPADCESLLDGVSIRVGDPEDAGTEPRDRAEKRVWSAYDLAEGRIDGVRSIADIIRPGYSVQGEGLIDGRPIDASMLGEAVRTLGGRYRTGSPEAEAATTLIEQLQRVSNPADTVTRHTRGLLARAPQRESRRADMRIATDAYVVVGSGGPRIRDAVPMTINGTDALAVRETRKGPGEHPTGPGNSGTGFPAQRPIGAFAGVAFTMSAFGALLGAAVNGASEFLLVPVLAVAMVWLYRRIPSALAFGAIGFVGAFVFDQIGFGSTSLFMPASGIIGAIMIAVHDKKHRKPELEFDAQRAGRTIDRL
ncbi:hypothetical protein ACEE18_01470 [Corynebacterium freneyi]